MDRCHSHKLWFSSDSDVHIANKGIHLVIAMYDDVHSRLKNGQITVHISAKYVNRQFVTESSAVLCLILNSATCSS